MGKKLRPHNPSIQVSNDPNCEQLSQEILQSGHTELPLAGFLRQTTLRLLDYFACELVELSVRREDNCLRCLARDRGDSPPDVQTRQQACRTASQVSCDESCGGQASESPTLILPLEMAGTTIGVLRLVRAQNGHFPPLEQPAREALAQALASALLSQLDHAALRERIKELTCLYRLTQLAETPGITAGDLFGGIARLLPQAWQYPEIAAARIVLDDVSYQSPEYGDFVACQSADIVVADQTRGSIDVVYRERRPEMDEGPFLKEERNLIEAVARHIPGIIQRRQAAEEEQRLQEQLRHADRLATIGQLAAGVAHELNEPLGNILAFAQLAEKQPGVPGQVADDLAKVVAASLHAREVVKKLMLFARQMPPQKMRVDLNRVVEEGLEFLQARCAKNGVVLKRRLSSQLPRITADPSQMNQVLVNLVVNAIQALPEGGTLKIVTCAVRGQVILVVEDDGIGMAPEVLQKIFIPFFTTKDIHDGTGLGLPVVHGIITAHQGAISVRSEPDRGARFEIRLPVRLPDDPQLVSAAADDEELPSNRKV